jgi:predicted phosphohydrolase
MKLIWMSDIHLNFLNEELRLEFYMRVKEGRVEEDAIVVSGDIAESHNVVKFLGEMKEVVGIPIYFVLGNHDFYGSSVKKVREEVKKLDGWLGQAPIELSKDTILLGVDGWGDCRNGDYENSRLTMSDWIYIDDLRKGYGKGMANLKKALQKLADADARKLKRNVLKAIEKGFKNIIIVTHVPPFEDVCLNAGRKSTPDGLPFFSSQCLGTAILPIAKKFPDIDFLWLSGHTHSRAVCNPCENMVVKVAKAVYFYPQIEEIIQI